MPNKPFSPGEARWIGPPVALLFEQSLVWGLICIETLDRLGVPFHLLSARGIVDGGLDSYRVLLVPGGWASHKRRALEEQGLDRIRHFVECGGSYMGFCGGAGLALSTPSAPGLVPLQRMSFSDRLQNASGEVWIHGVPGHPAWKDLPLQLPVSIWWPSQFSLHHMQDSICLATYKAAGADFTVADLPVADLAPQDLSWEEREQIYGINLNPSKLLGHPAIVEVQTGKGRFILSYPHLETPGDQWGNRLFSSMLTYLDEKAAEHHPGESIPSGALQGESCHPPGRETLGQWVRIRETLDDFIGFGERHLLWKWRRPWLLQWRRGIRGLEYGTLAVVVRTILRVAQEISADEAPLEFWLDSAIRIGEEVDIFCETAKRLLLEEKLCAQVGNLTKLGKVNETVDALRGRLFGRSMNHGGLSRTLFDQLDVTLLKILRLRSVISEQ